MTREAAHKSEPSAFFRGKEKKERGEKPIGGGGKPGIDRLEALEKEYGGVGRAT